MTSVIIMGPTGVGKTDLSLELARLIPLEIINADMGQAYAPLTIGTAKPVLSEAGHYRSIPHHGFNVLTEPIDYSVCAYRERTLAYMSDISKRGAVPVLVGGSSFYSKSLFFPPQKICLPVKYTDQEGKNVLLWDELAALDPVRAAQIHPHDVYRIERALAIWRVTGELPSRYKPERVDLGIVCIVFVDRDTEELKKRIYERVDLLFDEGWCEEVAGLSPAWHDFLLRKKLMGYSDIVIYNKTGMPSYGELKERIKRKTWQYARRQRIFWRSFKREVASDKITCLDINLTDCSFDQGLSAITACLRRAGGSW